MARHTRRAADLGLDAITIEGALIAPEQIMAVANTERSAKAAGDYGCPKGTNLGDEIARYFRIGQAHWQAYARIEQPTITQTAEFVRNLLSDAFGFAELKGPVEHVEGTRRYRIALEDKGGRVPIVVAAPAADGDGFAKALPEFGDGAGGRARRSPVVLLQDWLNANPDFYWGLVFAGDRVRLMRDNASLTRAAWIEADLGAMFRDEMFADFSAWWLLTHASRFGAAGTPASSAALEQWREEGLKQGTAARERLREGVEAALQELGQGVVEANSDIRQRIEAGELKLSVLFEELLRTVYRLIFLAVSEDRDLLHPRGTSQRARALYAGSYGFTYWRERSARRTAYDAHSDAWEGMKIALTALAEGEPLLGLPALGGLFSGDGTPTLNLAQIPNRRFLMAIHRLGFLTVDGSRTRINWRDMKTEELGSVYESLLEIRPMLAPNGEFVLDSGAKGSTRKTSGSYYTPDSLVETLLDSALQPVLERAEADGGVDAILDLNVIDPACGSGHFLLGAARRMADKIAELRDPDAPDRQTALRDVVSRCIHGVDRNPMAVELAKVALWIESVSPGQPLGFLDANIRCGDSLLGVFNLDVLEEGIPDEAYKPLTGDDKTAAKYYFQQNKAAKKGQGQFDWSGGGGAMPPRRLASNLSSIKALSEDTVRQVVEKKRRYEAWRNDPARWATRVACDLYIAAFLHPKTEVPPNRGPNMVPTTADVRTKLSGGTVSGPMEAVAVDAAETAHAFHWPLAFPDVMIDRGGFDVVIGNPPWERIKLQEQEFFAGTSVADEPNAAARARAIAKLRDSQAGSPDRELYDAFQVSKRVAEATSLFARVPGEAGGRYPFSGSGDINTFALFTELFRELRAQRGHAGIIIPADLFSSEQLSEFFQDLVSSGDLTSGYAFENEEFIFPGIANVNRFALVTLSELRDQRGIEFAFFLRSMSDFQDVRRKLHITQDDFNELNPNTRTCPIVRTRLDLELTRKIHAKIPILVRESLGSLGNPWNVKFLRMFDMASDSDLFRDEGTEGVPLYEGKFIWHFDYRFSSYHNVGKVKGRGGRGLPPVSLEEYQDADFEVLPRYWVEKPHMMDRLQPMSWSHGWFLGWRDVSNAKLERTIVASALPMVGVGHTLPLFFSDKSPSLMAALLASFNSLVVDFVARQKIGGNHIGFAYLNQLPILSPSAYCEADLAFIVPRVLELTYTSHAMAPFARDLECEGQPFLWDEARRARLRAELDAWFALAYGLTRDDLRYVLDPKDVMGEDYPSETFRVLQNNEMKQFGEYRTRRLVLAAYDELTRRGMRPRTEEYR